MTIDAHKLSEYWEKYKSIFDTPEFEKHEKYKWPVLAQCYQNWDWNSEDKATMFKKTFDAKGQKNLWLSGQFFPVRMIEQYYEIDADAVNNNFNILFDETKDLTFRIDSFKKFTNDFLLKLQETKPNDKIEQAYHGDLRAISIYLSLQYPEKYYIYKHGVFKDFCRAIELPNVKSGQVSNYIDYLIICDQIRDFIQEDQEFLNTYKTFCNKPEHYDDPSLHLLVQDFIYSVASYFSKPTEISYWIFQCNPDMFDLVTALDENILETWTVSAHKDKIKEGDKAIIWVTGDEAGCYALAEILSEPAQIPIAKDDHLWKEDHKTELRVRINVTHDFSDRPIYKSQIVDIKSLSGFKGGHQGTNFQSSKEEYDSLLNLSQAPQGVRYWIYSPGKNGEKWEEFFDLGIMAIGWDFLGDLTQYNDKKDIVAKLQMAENTTGSKKNDATANYEFCHIMKPNDVVFVKRGKFDFIGYGIVVSDYYFDDFRYDFKSCRKVNWVKKGNWKDRDIVLKTLTDITYYPEYYKRLLELLEVNTIQKKEMITYPLNTIFYGPPGTGKTYNTIKRAAEIISGESVDDYSEALKIFNEHLGNRIEFITFHQNYSYEDFIQGLRPDTENGNQLTFQKKDGIFKKIAVNAIFEYYKKLKTNLPLNGSQITDLNEVYLDFVQSLKMIENKEFDTATGLKIYISDFTKNDNIEFKHQNSSRSYLVSGNRLIKLYEKFPSIHQIKNVHNDIREAIGGCNTTVYFVALREFIQFKDKYINTDILEPREEYEEIGYESKKKLISTVDQDEIRKISTQDVPPYVIIIDEINRANISRVFGELITLIEPDKRSHGEIPLQCTLPSGDEFIVPTNLYIIGTMNTADKSIALLDIALRRRFEFESMYPLYEIKDKEIYDVAILKKINESIIKKKGHDFQIGHAYFMDNSQRLADRMNKRVNPLLLEYFMNDEKEVTEILKSAGLSVDATKWPLQILASS